MVASNISSLPNEILTQILHQGFGSEFEFVYLWSTLRNVSHRFRYVIEALVARVHLRKTYLTYAFSNPDLLEVQEHPRVIFWLSFKQLQAGQDDIAVFTPDADINATPRDPAWLRLMECKIADSAQEELVRPPHMISLIRYVNDTQLCGMKLNVVDAPSGTWELRLNWKETISHLILEERLRQGLSRRWIRQQRARSSALSEKPLHDLHHAMKLHLLSNRLTRDDSFQVARRKRIATQYKAAGIDYNKNVIGNREIALAMRRKGEDIENHQTFMNQFVFD